MDMANAASITAHLTTRGLPPTEDWLQSFLPSVRASTPVQATHQTALFRIRAADLTKAVEPTQAGTFSTNVSDANTKESRIPGPVTVQILDIEDIGRSRWSQVEALEAQERGETTRGREVIRVVPEEDNTQAADNNARNSSGPHKLLLQDARGTKAYGLEMSPVGIGVNTPIGTKLVLRNVVVARGVLLLEPDKTDNLGGKVEAWDQAWRDSRKQVLKEKAGWRDTA